MNLSRHYKALELDKVLLMLAEETSFSDARERALEITPSTDFERVQMLIRRTSDAHSLTARYGSPTLLSIQNVAGPLRRAQVGASLSLKELLHIAEVLRTVRGLCQWRRQCETMGSELSQLFSCLTPNREVEEAITSAVLSEDTLADNASRDLQEIRRKITNAGLHARHVLDKIIHSTTYQKFLQEQIVTIRDGRFVVPVKSEYRNEVKGLVHDTSGSGATLFIEPMSVVEANNEIKVLRAKEKTEMERIVAALSAQAGMFADEILDSYDAVIELDIIFAKARLAYKMKASVPVVRNDGVVNLIKARHPLIDPKHVVPTDISIGKSFDTLVITGPNTGGKTVSLKTLGLFCAMAMCGMMIPAFDGSEINVFSNILADIGDEQSIEQSLSTFSAHMTNIVKILQVADHHTLVLLDELGAGTDPVEGAALATAVLERLRELGCRIAATTHYAELKMYALNTSGVENACCEFDVATLSPTYRLLIGMPGRSNAFAISERLGLTGDIVARAKELMSGEHIRFEDVVSDLEQSRQELEQERDEARKLRMELEMRRREMEKQKEALEKQKEQEMERARSRAKRLVDQVKYDSQKLMEEIEEIRKQKESENYAAMAAKAKSELRAKLERLEDASNPVVAKTNEGYRLPRKLKQGDEVLIVDIDKRGTVIAPPDGEYVQVQAGIIKTKVHLKNLRLIENQPKKPVFSNTRNVRTSAKKMQMQAKMEIDLRGMMVEEALMELDQYIDSSVLAGLGTITIIHGKGTGALRAAVQAHLRKHPSVKDFRLGTYGEGESGVTIVNLK